MINGTPHGILLVGADHNNIVGNTIANIRTGDGITLASRSGNLSEYNLIESNNLYNIANTGIKLGSGVRYNSIKSNYIRNTGADGILLTGNSIYNTICENTVREADYAGGEYGIWIVAGSNNNMIHGNDLRGNGGNELNDLATGTLKRDNLGDGGWLTDA